MDSTTARKEIAEANQQLAKIEDQRQSLLAWIAGLEGWLQLHPDAASKQLLLPVKASTKPKGKVSFRGAVIEALRSARGEALHSKEILARVQAAGGVTESKTPQRMVELVIYTLMTRDDKPIVKVAPKTWRWAGITPRPK